VFLLVVFTVLRVPCYTTCCTRGNRGGEDCTLHTTYSTITVRYKYVFDVKLKGRTNMAHTWIAQISASYRNLQSMSSTSRGSVLEECIPKSYVMRQFTAHYNELAWGLPRTFIPARHAECRVRGLGAFNMHSQSGKRVLHAAHPYPLPVDMGGCRSSARLAMEQTVRSGT
jgi:hypothetical protein